MGIFARGHIIVPPFPFNHVSIRIVPVHQELWRAQRPDLFNHQDDHGDWFATIGGAPDTVGCSGTLTSGINRATDVATPISSFSPELLRYRPINEDTLITQLFQRSNNYDSSLTYWCWPESTEDVDYNSNSYGNGLLNAVDVPAPTFPTVWKQFYAGWATPVPKSAFEPH